MKLQFEKEKISLKERLEMVKFGFLCLLAPVSIQMRVKISLACFRTAVDGYVWVVK